MTERLLTIDPGLANVGFAVMSKGRVYAYGMITTPSKWPIVERIRKINRTLLKIYKQYKCSLILMEDFHGAMSMQNRKTAMDVAKAHGALYLLPGKILLISPSSVEKNKTRNRELKKTETVKRVNRKYTLTLPFSYNHVADAITQGDFFYEKTRS